MFRPIGLSDYHFCYFYCLQHAANNDVKLEHCCLPHWYVNNVIFLIVRIVKNTDVN